MREEEFRERLRGALGEPPASLGAPMLGRQASSGAARTYQRLMGLLAIGVAVLLILVLVGSRVTLRPRGNVLPAATPTGVAQLALDSMPCHLAVYMVQEAENPGQPSAPATSLGFVNIPSGTFFADPRGTVQDLPAGSTPSAALYSAELHRWLPATNRSISPDHRSYAYVKLTPPGATFNKATGSELHVVDGATGSDRKLWASGADIEVIEWTSSGILASTVPWQGGIKLLWRVDPVTFFGEIATLGTILVTLIYLVSNFALPVYYRRNHPDQFSVVKHLLLPMLGVLAIGFPLWGLVQPGQAAPFNLFPWIALAVVIVALVYAVSLSRRDRTLGDRVGSIVADRE